jgi:transglutaminase-like putative cysteine protease
VNRAGWLGRVLSVAARSAVHGLAWAFVVLSFTSPGMAMFAFLAGALGCAIGGWLGATRVRSWVVLLFAAFFALLGTWFRVWLTEPDLWAELLGPIGAITAAELVAVLVYPAAVSAVFRTLSVRHGVFAVFELLLVAVAFAQLFVAHRGGAINRPFRLTDPIIALGGDPTWLFVVMGGIATALGLLLLLKERRFGRLLFHMGIVAALLGLIIGLTPVMGMPAPPIGAGLGLRPGEKPAEGQDSNSKDASDGPVRNELQFRDDYSDASTPVPVAVVLFHDDYSPPGGVYYFRQGAFSQYNGRKLVVSGSDGVDEDLIASYPTQRQRIEGAPAGSSHRGPLETTVALMADHTQPFGLEAPVEVEPMQNPDPNRFRRVYQVRSAVLTTDYAAMLDYDLGAEAWTQAQWRHYTQGPEDPRYAELAEQIASELPQELRDNAVAKALAVAGWLSEEGVYSLKNAHGGSQDPTASFLFGDLTGYCVHFAHAATYLMRALGVPSRVATGYAVAESARRGGSSLVLAGAAAHAWPEVYVDGFGWVVVDVYPEQALDAPAEPVDPDLQRLLGELARGASPIPISATDLPRLKEMARRVSWATGTWLLSLLGLALFGLYAIKIWRRVAPGFSSADGLPRVVYRAELDRLSDVALRRRMGESREAFARRVRATVPGFASLTDAHIGAAFGRARPDPGRLRRDAKLVRSELRVRFPRWKRLVGLLTPWSWLRSR